MVFKYSLGMIMSVSTLEMSSGAATPFRLVKAIIPAAAPSVTSKSRITAPAESEAAAFCSSCSGEEAGAGMAERVSSRTSHSRPVTAAAAAIAGEQRCVRPPAPCRPSKLRLDVEAQRSCAPSLSGFIARHIEQPGSRHSKPASMRMVCSPSSSASSFTSPEPGTTSACFTRAATFLPFATAATARMSSMRELVQLPMKTLSIAIASTRFPTCASSPMYLSARSYAARRAGSASSAGRGTTPVIGAVCSGEVPHVTVGAMSAASMCTSLSKCAPSSVRSERQYESAAAHSTESGFGTIGLPLRYAKVTSSGAMSPARAPASMAMLEMDMRASIESERMAEPANSMVAPVPPAVPITPQMWSTMSLDVTPIPSSPSTCTSMLSAFFCGSVDVASTCSTSDVPMPKASAPKAPCVAVCESPQTHVQPGTVKPCSGPMMCTIPCRLSAMPKYGSWNFCTFSSTASTCARDWSSWMNDSMDSKAFREKVGTLWSTVTRVQSGRRTGRPATERPSNAWGEVTSCTRWRSM
mmetsp:Transcript_9618/g.23867  ORF Transcript_9618/g.23867 Transcript_9618/m.23867 type:complete len:525 (+) Transcript_9618:1168-2742(+)